LPRARAAAADRAPARRIGRLGRRVAAASRAPPTPQPASITRAGRAGVAGGRQQGRVHAGPVAVAAGLAQPYAAVQDGVFGDLTGLRVRYLVGNVSSLVLALTLTYPATIVARNG
jgi:hypothetical protein